MANARSSSDKHEFDRESFQDCPMKNLRVPNKETKHASICLSLPDIVK